MQPILGFISSFPTATIVYIALVLMTDLKFDFLWFVAAVVLDLLDDFFSQGP